MRVELLAIDCQNDFCDPGGALYVPGAENDMTRLAAFIARIGSHLHNMHFTLDSHHTVDVGHPIFWKNSAGESPEPFTTIAHQDVKAGNWLPYDPAFTQRMLDYTRLLEENNRYQLTIWPIHCRIATWGSALYPAVDQAVRDWESSQLGVVDFVTKGLNIFTEHYSAVKADVPDPDDPSTQLNTDLIQKVERCDQVIIVGEALSHCVASTVRDVAAELGDEGAKKFVILEDCSSNVPGFESLGDAFLHDMSQLGVTITNSVDFMR